VTSSGQVPGIWIKGGTDPNQITIEASELAAAEIERLFGSVVLIEPEIRAGTQPNDVYGSLPYEGQPKMPRRNGSWHRSRSAATSYQ
jgi:hypothetical protein